MSLKIKCHLYSNVTYTQMSLYWNVTKTEMSLILKCHYKIDWTDWIE